MRKRAISRRLPLIRDELTSVLGKRQPKEICRKKM